MEKGEYLDLAKQKGWNIKIPQLEDGTYDCDVFGGDDVEFEFDVHITGNMSLGNNANVYDISTGGDIVLGDNAIINKISAGGCTILGYNADIGSIRFRKIPYKPLFLT